VAVAVAGSLFSKTEREKDMMDEGFRAVYVGDNHNNNVAISSTDNDKDEEETTTSWRRMVGAFYCYCHQCPKILPNDL
jgi:hypothetical protein